MNRSSIPYWIVTGLLAFAFTGAGFADITQQPPIVEAMHHLGYPEYLSGLLGAWKLAGAVAIVAPGFRRVKEWAYAGMLFDMSGAVYSHIASGDGPSVFAAPLILGLLAVASWWLRPADRRLAD